MDREGDSEVRVKEGEEEEGERKMKIGLEFWMTQVQDQRGQVPKNSKGSMRKQGQVVKLRMMRIVTKVLVVLL